MTQLNGTEFTCIGTMKGTFARGSCKRRRFCHRIGTMKGNTGRSITGIPGDGKRQSDWCGKTRER